MAEVATVAANRRTETAGSRVAAPVQPTTDGKTVRV